jgi:hypothetical protein
MRWIAFALLAALTPAGVLSSPSTAQAADCDYFHRCRGYVVPCSLDGVNPLYHPYIFNNPAIARAEYGFIRSRDGTWHVETGCVRGPYHGG